VKDPRVSRSPEPRVGFVLEGILGHATHARNLERLVSTVGGIDSEFYAVPFAVTGVAARVPLYRSNWSLRAGLRSRRAIRAMHRRAPLDALFVHTQTPAVLSPDWLRRLPTVVSIDATPEQYDELGAQYAHEVGSAAVERAKHRANELCFRQAAGIVSWSAWARAGLERSYGIPAEQVRVIAPGVDLARWRRPERNHPEAGPTRVLFVGGDLERKGGKVLLEAARRLRSTPGTPDFEVDLVTTAEVAAEPGVVVHRGLTPNDPALIALYHRADVFCLPTAGDCLPMVLAEAGAAGLPLVSTPVGGIPEIVRSGCSGELVPIGDPSALAAVLGRLLAEPDYRRRMGEGASRVVAEDHDAARNAGRVVELIVDTVRRARAKRSTAPARTGRGG
jgi:glycosyltransferase involved in cell wall biosynthesis